MISAHAPWPYPTLFAHRGGGSLAPENTLAAIEVGIAHNFTAVEFDVKLSRDHIALLMHDDTLDRTTRVHGKIANETMTFLETLDAGAWHSEEFSGERIPRLSAVMRYLHIHGIIANVEIKPCEGREAETGRAVAAWCSEYTQASVVKPLLSSFSESALVAAHETAPELPLGLLVETPNIAQLARVKALHAVSLHCHHLGLTREFIASCHQQGTRVLTYTVNEPDRIAALVEMGVDGIFTDNLGEVAKRFPALLRNSGQKPLIAASA